MNDDQRVENALSILQKLKLITRTSDLDCELTDAGKALATLIDIFQNEHKKQLKTIFSEEALHE